MYSISIYLYLHIHTYTQEIMLLRASVDSKNDVTFAMVSIGYKNNAMVWKFYYGTLGVITRDVRGMPSRDITLDVH